MTHDPRFPDRDECTVPGLLRRRAREQPDDPYATFTDTGEEWSFMDAYAAARAAARGLRQLGVVVGDRVLAWLPNGAEVLRVWFGANLLGAAFVPMNLAYRGAILEHVIRISQAKVLVVHATLLDRLADVDLAGLEVAVVVGPGPPSPELLVATAPFELLTGDGAGFTEPETPVEPWDTQCVVFTSGTTGPSKGVLCSHLHQYETVRAVADNFRPGERSLIALPLYHAGATQDAYAALVIGGSFVVCPRFRTEEFWDVVRAECVTVVTLLGAMARFLLSRPESPDDADNPLRTVFLVPFTEDGARLRDRFGVDVYTVFNMTEVSAPIVSARNPDRVGSCGRARAGVTLRLVDEHDRPVPIGEVGELIVRTDTPWAMSHGYLGMPAETAHAWRNGWFHTGDAFRCDAAGDYFFVDRMKDAIRRRGENISSFEVEADVAAHPDVQDAAAVPVPSADTENDVLVVVTAVPGRTIDPEALTRWLIPRMPHFMVPRYVRVVDTLPRTPTNKVRKYLLRQDGVTPDTWDRATSGLVLGGTRTEAHDAV
ncbi:AMP-binding protein [Actinocrispum wychmicini]|uniref:Crotonobetaine/carnitine-CoA ligase n=1 Tax=Actinocrispum wychmicini TaxID=1213861 RepID=A0A4R2JY06_9PSEU|nr:AMP-binding protein [Actinocrispum wychmicini]TCO62109.1 crotonobetaine/carnitine-CoA ligase [Actinocrispum wychmicini]